MVRTYLRYVPASQVRAFPSLIENHRASGADVCFRQSGQGASRPNGAKSYPIPDREMKPRLIKGEAGRTRWRGRGFAAPGRCRREAGAGGGCGAGTRGGPPQSYV
ncbi:hypothetical protein GCM10010329_40490 [Streptomyces spiroverticillatus]|uniref:Uncharacterized protein n=1 Tax=Streptomyces finlayi TaxID=67296 RepID=A0A918WZG1_9ACTN|nr:hypothetical protein GCM10010329_40490 [Streptomyces spiroverticillatus]GHC97870.1 hypothetical protein GCM10010334_39750 [Streptomyces finlayi]